MSSLPDDTSPAPAPGPAKPTTASPPAKPAPSKPPAATRTATPAKPAPAKPPAATRTAAPAKPAPSKPPAATRTATLAEPVSPLRAAVADPWAGGRAVAVAVTEGLEATAEFVASLQHGVADVVPAGLAPVIRGNADLTRDAVLAYARTTRALIGG